jgi:hypothetical protein
MYIEYIVNLYRTVWKWLTRSTDRTCTFPLQATALTHIIRLQVSYILQYLAIYSYNSDFISAVRLPKLSFRSAKLENKFRII